MVTEWKIKPSKYLIGLTLIFYALSCVALFIASIPLSCRILLCMLLFADGCRIIYFRMLQRSLSSIVKCGFKEKHWYLFDQVGNIHAANLLTSTVVLSQCVLLYFRGKRRWQYYTVVVFKDAFETIESFRRLKALLKFGV